MFFSGAFIKLRKANISFVMSVRRYNEELYCLYDETDLVTTIKITRLRWAGHIVRMQDNTPCKKITLDKPEGRRRAGRPKPQMDGRSDERWREAGIQELED